MLRRPIALATVLVLAAIAGCTAIRPGAAPTGASARSAGVAAPVPGPPVTGYLARQGTRLFLGGAPYQAVGLNAYELATDWGSNYGCGGKLDDATLERFFASLPAHAMVRAWGFQGAMATNPVTHQRDWTGLDRVVAAAERHGDLLVLALGNQDGSCDDGHWKNAAWYSGGYRQLFPGDGYTVATVSYWDWVHEIVGRYRNSAAIGMWEPVNEPEASECAPGYQKSDCYPHLRCDETGASAALRSFFDSVGQEIKRVDPNHLVETGSMGGGQCGWAGADFASVSASPGVDVVGYHDYSQLPATPTELTTRAGEARGLGKPLLVGELGLQATSAGPGCSSRAARLATIQTKSRALLSNGIAGVLLWDWVPDPQAGCSFDIGPGDPVLGALVTSIGTG